MSSPCAVSSQFYEPIKNFANNKPEPIRCAILTVGSVAALAVAVGVVAARTFLLIVASFTFPFKAGRDWIVRADKDLTSSLVLESNFIISLFCCCVDVRRTSGISPRTTNLAQQQARALPRRSNIVLDRIRRSNQSSSSVGPIHIDPNLGPKCLEIGYSIDWEKDCPDFEPTFTFNVLDNNHLFWSNPLLTSQNKQDFQQFLAGLMRDYSVKDKGMKRENIDRIFPMVLMIMNRIKNRGDDFKSVVVDQICVALKNCSNRINVEIERIAYQVTQPDVSTLERFVKVALQNMRNKIFQKTIHNILSEFYLTHEASSFNYYYGRMSHEFGLPTSVASLDDRFQAYAQKGEEEKIRYHFHKEYCFQTIIENICKIVNDPQDPEIPSALFNEWVQGKYGDSAYDLLDDNGHYSQEPVRQLLEEIGVIKLRQDSAA